MERALRLGGKLLLKTLEASVEGAVQGGIDCIGPKGLDLMIENDWYIIESMFYAMRYRPDYPEGLTKEEIARLEKARHGMLRAVMPILQLARTVASRLPPELIEQKLDGGWFMRRAKEKFPVLAERVEAHGDKGKKWIENQAREVRDFLLGRLVWDDRERRLVRAEVVKRKVSKTAS